MSKVGYLGDIFARTFFLFVALQLVLRSIVLSVFLAVSLNLIYELTVGRKFWLAWKNTPKKPHRNWRIILRELWHRAFCRERTKGLVLAGIMLLFMSYVVKFQIYYRVVAGLIFLLAAASRFAPSIKSATIPHEPPHDETVRAANCPPVTAD